MDDGAARKEEHDVVRGAVVLLVDKTSADGLHEVVHAHRAVVGVLAHEQRVLELLITWVGILSAEPAEVERSHLVKPL